MPTTNPNKSEIQELIIESRLGPDFTFEWLGGNKCEICYNGEVICNTSNTCKRRLVEDFIPDANYIPVNFLKYNENYWRYQFGY